jgi:hypothetical protein
MDANAKILDLIFGRWRSQILYAGVELGIFDVVERTPRTAGDVANRLGLEHWTAVLQMAAPSHDPTPLGSTPTAAGARRPPASSAADPPADPEDLRRLGGRRSGRSGSPGGGLNGLWAPFHPAGREHSPTDAVGSSWGTDAVWGRCRGRRGGWSTPTHRGLTRRPGRQLVVGTPRRRTPLRGVSQGASPRPRSCSASRLSPRRQGLLLRRMGAYSGGTSTRRSGAASLDVTPA